MGFFSLRRVVAISAFSLSFLFEALFGSPQASANAQRTCFAGRDIFSINFVGLFLVASCGVPL